MFRLGGQSLEEGIDLEGSPRCRSLSATLQLILDRLIGLRGGTGRMGREPLILDNRRSGYAMGNESDNIECCVHLAEGSVANNILKEQEFDSAMKPPIKPFRSISKSWKCSRLCAMQSYRVI